MNKLQKQPLSWDFSPHLYRVLGSFEHVLSACHRKMLIPSQCHSFVQTWPRLTQQEPLLHILYLCRQMLCWIILPPNSSTPRQAEQSLTAYGCHTPFLFGPKTYLASQVFSERYLGWVLKLFSVDFSSLFRDPLYPKMPWGLIMEVTLIHYTAFRMSASPQSYTSPNSIDRR